MTRAYFKPYEGSEPYIFISYAHADAREVMRIASDMHDRGFNVWYDEGIAAGSEWTESVAEHLGGAALMVGFVSGAYVASANCRREMSFAAQHNVRIINIFLERTELTPGLELQVGGIWALMKYDFHSEDYFFRKLYSAPDMAALGAAEEPTQSARRSAAGGADSERRARRDAAAPERARNKRAARRKGRIAAVLLVLAAVASLIIVGELTGFTGRMRSRLFGGKAVEALPDDTVAVFSNMMVEAAARQFCGKGSGDVTVGDLAGLTELYFCGSQYSFSKPFVAPDAPTGESSYVDSEGNTVERGMIVSLADFAYFPSLTTLQVSYQALTNLDTLPACNLTTLIVSSDRLTSLKGVERLPLLTVLDAANSPITDVAGISACTRLQSVDLTGSSVLDWTEFSSLPDLKEARVSGADYASLKPLIMLHSLTSAEFYDCDLRGDFFDVMDSRKLTSVRLADCAVDSLAGADKLKSLSELWLIRVSGISDYSPLDSCPALESVHIDGSMRQYFASPGMYRLIVEDGE